jgi:4-diphosphocytidyl-2-C-methyl-D-erythritol kinase
MRLLAPAKLNLYLRVLGKRPDGYHELETLFERVDLADELTVDPQPDGLTLTCSDPTLSCGEDNLVLRAARLLGEETGTSRGARMRLLKRIPVAAGLGGGSSDAAAALLGLNRLWGLRLPADRLRDLAARLGSDVAFFLTGAAFAIGRGRGEQCEPLPADVRLAHVLVVPPVRLSTSEVYAGAQFDLTARRPSITMMAHALRNGSLGELADGLWNDLEPEAIRRCPLISHIQLCLRELGCVGSRVSGSGPSVFGLCRDLAHAQDVARRLSAAQGPGAAWRIELIQTTTPSHVVTPADV